MQGRHRSPVDGLRSPGIGRFPKDVHGGGGGGYGGSGYRNFGRGGKYRRAPPPKPSHSYLPPPPPPPPRKADIMMEAGRLAAEYFVSKGVIPASSLPPKWPSDSVSLDSKVRDRDGSSSHGRASALDRLGNSSFDSGYGRRKYSDERDHAGQGQQTWGRRKRDANSSRSRGSDWGRDDRNGSWADNRSRYPNENGVEDDDDAAAPGYKPSGGYDYYGSSRNYKASAADSEPRSEESEMDNYDGGDDTGSKASSSSTRKDPIPDVDAEPMARMNEGETLNTEADNARSDENPDQESKDTMDEDSPEQIFVDEDDSSKHAAADLLKLCSSAKVPTKPRSSVTNRSAKVDQITASAVPETIPKVDDRITASAVPETIAPESSIPPKNDEIPSAWTTSDTEPSSTGPTGDTNAAPAQDDPVPAKKNVSQLCHGEPTTSVPISNAADSGPDDSAALPLYSAKESANRNAVVHATENKSCTRSLSFPEKFSAPPQEDSSPALVLSSNNRSCSRSFSFPETSSIAVLSETVGKSPGNPEVSAGDGFALQSGQSGGTKRPREWYSDIASPNEFGLMRILRAKQLGSQDNGLFPDQGMGFEQKKPTAALFHNGEPLCQVKMEEDQRKPTTALFHNSEPLCQVKLEEDRRKPTTPLFHNGEPLCQVKLEEDQRSNSFKICDLNLMHAPEITEVPDDPANDTSNSSAVKDTEKMHSVDFGLSISNDPKIADLYSQHPNSDKGITIIDLEVDSPVQDEVWDPSKHKGETMYPNLDNYLHPTEPPDDLPDIQAISDLLGSDPSVSADMNNLHPGMTIPGTEGIPADDDSIYVALGEIPIAFMDVWGPPTQEYGKFF